jgi:hypothetical protein
VGNGITYDDRFERRDLMMPVDFSRAALVFVDGSMPSDKRARCFVLQIPISFNIHIVVIIFSKASPANAGNSCNAYLNFDYPSSSSCCQMRRASRLKKRF